MKKVIISALTVLVLCASCTSHKSKLRTALSVDESAFDSITPIPLGMEMIRSVGDSEHLDHSIMMLGQIGTADKATGVMLITARVRGNMDFLMTKDSVPIAACMPYCNITVARVGDMVVTFAPHHAVIGFSALPEQVEQAFANSGWSRIAKTDFLLNFDTLASIKYAVIPHVQYAETVVGKQVTLEGVQMGQKKSYTNLVSATGMLFPIPTVLRKAIGESITSSKLYGIKIPFDRDKETESAFGGLSGSPVYCGQNVIGTLVGHLIPEKITSENGYAVLLIQSIVSPDMTIQ